MERRMTLEPDAMAWGHAARRGLHSSSLSRGLAGDHEQELMTEGRLVQ
jgi:hypothetical protein